MACPHCELAEPSTAPWPGGQNGATDGAIARAIEVMARMDRERTPEQHEKYVRAVIWGAREHLIQRHLYDAVVAELRPQRDAT